VDPILNGFLDTSLNSKVKHGYHALAIDEKRAQFPPTLWDEPTGPNQTLEQVWFTGAHSDVGGGEPIDGTETTALSDIALSWMIDKARALGLQFDENVRKLYASPLSPHYALDAFHQSWKFFCGFPKRRTISTKASIANSVAIRCAEEATWRPENLTFQNGSLAGTYQIVNVCSLAQAEAAAAVAKASDSPSAASAGSATQAAGAQSAGKTT
jgi:hypothetical protein